MRLQFILYAAILLSHVQAQMILPKSFKPGELLFLDSTHLKGFIKENIRKDASVIFIAGPQGKRKQYNANNLISVDIDSITFICLHGDFFKIICDGELAFVQKSSDASNIPVYNGPEAIFFNSTEGIKGDYFIYEKKAKVLKLVSKKNMNEIAVSIFKGYAPAITMAEKAYSEITLLKDAIDLYNKRMIDY